MSLVDIISSVMNENACIASQMGKLSIVSSRGIMKTCTIIVIIAHVLRPSITPKRSQCINNSCLVQTRMLCPSVVHASIYDESL